MHQESNVFDPDFLSSFGDLNLPASSYEAETAGPWRVDSESQDRHEIRQDGDDEPAAVVAQRKTALLLAAVTPLEARAPLYRLDDIRQADGYRLQYEAAPEGWLRYYRPEVVEALNLLAHLVRSPAALALVLEAAGQVALGRAGAILAESLRSRVGESDMDPGSGNHTTAWRDNAAPGLRQGPHDRPGNPRGLGSPHRPLQGEAPEQSP